MYFSLLIEFVELSGLGFYSLENLKQNSVKSLVQKLLNGQV